MIAQFWKRDITRQGCMHKAAQGRLCDSTCRGRISAPSSLFTSLQSKKRRRRLTATTVALPTLIRHTSRLFRPFESQERICNCHLKTCRGPPLRQSTHNLSQKTHPMPWSERTVRGKQRPDREKDLR
ncbi:unnamed protein product [Ixodes pacificus]